MRISKKTLRRAYARARSTDRKDPLDSGRDENTTKSICDIGTLNGYMIEKNIILRRYWSILVSHK